MSEIKKIFKMGHNKVVIVPKKSDLEVGEYVMLTRIDTNENATQQVQRSKGVTNDKTTR